MEWIENQLKVHVGFSEPEYGTLSWQASKVAAFESFLAELSRPAELLIDIGCFSGALTARFRRFAGRVVGIDVHAEALAEAAKRGIETIQLDISAGRQVPLPAGCADVIVCADVIEHVVDPRDLMNEARRLLKPDGTLLLSTPNLGYWLSLLRLMMGRAPLCTNGGAPGFRSGHWVDPSHLHEIGRAHV